MKTQHQDFIATLYKMDVFKFGNFKLKSGEITPIYINLRKIISYPNLLRSAAELIWQKIKNCQFDLICGVPFAALPIATCLSLEKNRPLIMRRKEKKDYGTKQIIEGDFKEGQTCLIVEDVVTTGRSILETGAELESVGLKVQDAVALIDREENNLITNYTFHPVFTFYEILEFLLQFNVANETEKNIIQNFLMNSNK